MKKKDAVSLESCASPKELLEQFLTVSSIIILEGQRRIRFLGGSISAQVAVSTT